MNPGTEGNVYRFATRNFGEGGWRYIDCEPGLEVMYLQNRL